MTKGYVYVIFNRSQPGMLKIGHSLKDPHLRAKELGGTHNPSRYEVLYDVLVHLPYDIEQKVHRHLSQFQIENLEGTGREWFTCDLKVAISAIKFIAAENMILEITKPPYTAELEPIDADIKEFGNELVNFGQRVARRAVASVINRKHDLEFLADVERSGACDQILMSKGYGPSFVAMLTRQADRRWIGGGNQIKSTADSVTVEQDIENLGNDIVQVSEEIVIYHLAQRVLTANPNWAEELKAVREVKVERSLRTQELLGRLKKHNQRVSQVAELFAKQQAALPEQKATIAEKALLSKKPFLRRLLETLRGH